MHELGHLVHFRLVAGYWINVRVDWTGFRPEISDQLTGEDKLINMIVAFLFGLIPILFSNSFLLFIVYLIGCSLDFVICLFIGLYLYQYGFNKPMWKVFGKKVKQ